MHPKILFALVVVLLLGLAAGCGGGEEGGQGAQEGGGNQGQDEAAPQGPERETQVGVVRRVKVDERVGALVVQHEDAEPVRFRLNPESTRVTLDGEEADLGAIERGQNAEVVYVVRRGEGDREINAARAVRLQSGGAEAGGTTG